MKIYIGERQSGKTTLKIKFCDEENALLCELVKHNEALRKGKKTKC